MVMWMKITLAAILGIYYLNTILVILRILTDYELNNIPAKTGMKKSFKWFIIPFSALW